MKRIWRWALLLLLCLLSACTAQTPAGDLCYYLRGDAAEIRPEQSVFATEVRQTVAENELKSRVQTYLSGPVDPTLKSPFPEQLRVVDLRHWNSTETLEITLSEEYETLTGAELTLANACLVWTVTEYENINRLILRCESDQDVMGGHNALSREMFLTVAASSDRERTIMVYFADENNRYLMPTARKVVASENDSLGAYVLHQLLVGPTEEGLYPVMPEGTRLLGLTVEDGLATVDLSTEFYSNRPRSELGERMTLYALVNSLTELDEITSVRILVDGQSLGYYTYMILSEPMTRVESAIGPVRTAVNEFDATLYYRSWSDEQIAAAPTRIVRDDTESMGEQIFYALQESEPPSGLTNLIPPQTRLLSMETIEGVCYVDLSAGFAKDPGSIAVERQRVNALVASLCSIDSIDSVVLTIEGGTVTMPNYHHDREIKPLSNWFFPS